MPSQSPSLSSQPSSLPSISVAPTTCENIVESSEAQPLTTTGGVLTFNFPDLPNANTDVTVEVFARGDLGQNNEVYEIFDEDENRLGRVAPKIQCSSNYASITFTIGQDKFNSYIANDGAYTIIADASSRVSQEECQFNDVYVQLTYTSCFKTVFPTSRPSLLPSNAPSISSQPSSQPSMSLSEQPSSHPSSNPTSSGVPSLMVSCVS